MKEKIWFIFKLGDKHHRGPFSQEEIGRLLQQDKLPEDIILWREGMKRWKPLDQCPEFNAPPATRPPPQDIKKALQEIHQQQKEKDVPENIDSALARETLEEASEHHKEPSAPSPDQNTEESYVIRYCLGLATIFLVSFLIWPKNLFNDTVTTTRSLPPKERRYLEQVAAIDSNKKSLFRLALNKKRDQLWLASNYKGEGKVFLTLNSNPDKTLSLEKVTIKSQTSFRRGYARFTRFTLVKGNWPIPGEYQATIHLYPKNRKQQVVMWKGLFVLPPKGKKSLSQSLETWKKNIHERHLSPLKRQYQYYKTLKSQLTNMKDFYKKSFQASSWQEFSTLFEQHYNNEVGPLLQRFILDGRHLHLSLFNSDSKNSKEYEKIFQYGKKIGALASDMATLTGQGNIKELEKSHIGQNLLSRLNELIEQADSSLKELQEKISYQQKELPQY